VEQQGKLFATDACSRVRDANAVRQYPTQRTERVIAGGMAELIVPSFEVVDIHHQQCEWPLLRLPPQIQPLLLPRRPGGC
jgi:hypothetical protein